MLQIQFTSDWYKIEVKKSNKQNADLSPKKQLKCDNWQSFKVIILYFITFANQNVFRNLKCSFHFMFSVLSHPSSSSSDPPFTAARPHKWLRSGFGKKSIANKWPAGSQSAPSVRIRAWWVATNGGKQIHAGVAMKWQILAIRLCKREPWK